jgi:anti-sigma factor RsiW
MTHELPVTEDELHALLDGELPDDRRQDVEAWLAAHPDDAARMAAWRAQADMIRRRYGGVVEEPVPERLALDRLLHTRAPRPWLAAVAALLALMVGAAGGWFGRGAWDIAPMPATITADAIKAYKLYAVEVRHPVEVPGSEAAHLQQWLSRRVEHPLRAPDLELMGLKLVGGRLLPGPRGAAAFFMYEATSGERYTLYCSHAGAADATMRYRDAGKAAAYYWTDEGFTYVMSGPPDRDRLHLVANDAYRQLERGGRPQRSTWFDPRRMEANNGPPMTRVPVDCCIRPPSQP